MRFVFERRVAVQIQSEGLSTLSHLEPKIQARLQKIRVSFGIPWSATEKIVFKDRHYACSSCQRYLYRRYASIFIPRSFLRSSLSLSLSLSLLLVRCVKAASLPTQRNFLLTFQRFSEKVVDGFFSVLCRVSRQPN